MYYAPIVNVLGASAATAARLLRRSRSDFGALDTGRRIDFGDGYFNVFNCFADLTQPMGEPLRFAMMSPASTFCAKSPLIPLAPLIVARG
jgi:hypothetical protein